MWDTFPKKMVSFLFIEISYQVFLYVLLYEKRYKVVDVELWYGGMWVSEQIFNQWAYFLPLTQKTVEVINMKFDYPEFLENWPRVFNAFCSRYSHTFGLKAEIFTIIGIVSFKTWKGIFLNLWSESLSFGSLSLIIL